MQYTIKAGQENWPVCEVWFEGRGWVFITNPYDYLRRLHMDELDSRCQSVEDARRYSE
jgi:hypothetical protein